MGGGGGGGWRWELGGGGTDQSPPGGFEARNDGVCRRLLSGFQAERQDGSLLGSHEMQRLSHLPPEQAYFSKRGRGGGGVVVGGGGFC